MRTEGIRVVHVAPSFARRDGGPSEVLRGLLPQLIDRGFDVRLVTTDKGATSEDRDLHAVVPTEVARARRPHSWTFAPSILAALWRSIADADVVHIHSIHTFPTTVAMIVSRLRRVPYIIEPHGALDAYHLREGGFKKNLYMRLLDRWGLKGLCGAVYSSLREAREGSRVISAPEILMPLGVDESLFELEKVRSPEATLLFLGRLARKKRVDLAILALAQPPLSDRAVRLVVAGPFGEDLPYDPVALAREAGVRERVEFIGVVGAEERRRLLAAADVFVIASEDESFGVALAEALAAGCAAVASEQTGFAPEAAVEGALVIAELTPAHVAAAVAAALDECDNFAARGREFASERFRWAEAAKILDDSYVQLARQR
ncbi:glycosyltransferase [Microbacterium sp. No. 7]|uniref:glycosyltransferase n=1 Tax=Microbacterium sp. No. 7 TaxID=1714373 RepID=UPI0030098BCD